MVDMEKLSKKYFYWGYPYAAIVSLLEKRHKSNGVGVVRMYVTTCVTNKLEMNPVHLQQFLLNLQIELR